MDSIIHGDASEEMQRLPDASVDLIVSDIPYGINYKSNSQNYNRRSGETIKTNKPLFFDRIKGDIDIPLSWLTEAYRVLKNDCAIYIFCHWSKWHLLFGAVESAGFAVKNMIVMNKSNWGMGNLKSWAPQHELLLFATKGKHVLNFPHGRKSDVWNVPVRYSGAKRFHPNEKPLSWLTPCIVNSSKEGDLVLDPFCGSGSTGVAAKELKRRYLMIDIDIQHVNTARQRLTDVIIPSIL